ncbi:DUF4430 domain-containing protein [Bacillus timonensis]|nr:DUF4430 domain-containing protein [Bacillus timonensis]
MRKSKFSLIIFMLITLMGLVACTHSKKDATPEQIEKPEVESAVENSEGDLKKEELGELSTAIDSSYEKTDSYPKEISEFENNQEKVDEETNKSNIKNQEKSSLDKKDTKENTTEKNTENKTTSQSFVQILIVGKGTILNTTSVEVKNGDTVLSVLQAVTKKNGIPISVVGSGTSAYIEGIANLFEFDYGPKSGWVFKVNGTKSNVGAGSVKVKSGDSIEWIYSEDLGRDVE